jgi:Flp pilus assembly protein TadD
LPPKQQQVNVPVKPSPGPPPAPPKPISDGERFVNLGIKSFKNGDYGVAVLRFRQASESEPPGPRALFLQGQACIAAGKYREAVQLIQRGLRRDPDWPLAAFRPRVELYENKNELWKEHRNALEKANKLDPNNADYLFLLGYLDWFGGDRDGARAYFQKSRALADDVRWTDAFLKMAKGN